MILSVEITQLKCLSFGFFFLTGDRHEWQSTCFPGERLLVWHTGRRTSWLPRRRRARWRCWCREQLTTYLHSYLRLGQWCIFAQSTDGSVHSYRQTRLWRGKHLYFSTFQNGRPINIRISPKYYAELNVFFFKYCVEFCGWWCAVCLVRNFKLEELCPLSKLASFLPPGGWCYQRFIISLAGGHLFPETQRMTKSRRACSRSKRERI